ncbi:fumarylacetoacetate hydrolase family protein [Fonticella tunisiensis]|uniref:fumarylacetoacetate hydrolase family protein n=1 Tax=Fonticella tunisiensis TaxID=1096341 RepID=UPI00105B3CFE|nr:fumarylacetoacetate hydrolase family protein [Fonticella tunisiensis]
MVPKYITSILTLKPGDIIATGTPSGISEVKNGDVMEVVIEGIGRLRNRVKVKIVFRILASYKKPPHG